MAIDIERIAEAIDHLVTAPMSNWTILKGIPLGTLYAASRARGGGLPLSLAGAPTRTLNNNLRSLKTLPLAVTPA